MASLITGGRFSHQKNCANREAGTGNSPPGFTKSLKKPE